MQTASFPAVFIHKWQHLITHTSVPFLIALKPGVWPCWYLSSAASFLLAGVRSCDTGEDGACPSPQLTDVQIVCKHWPGQTDLRLGVSHEPCEGTLGSHPKWLHQRVNEWLEKRRTWGFQTGLQGLRPLTLVWVQGRQMLNDSEPLNEEKRGTPWGFGNPVEGATVLALSAMALHQAGPETFDAAGTLATWWPPAELQPPEPEPDHGPQGGGGPRLAFRRLPEHTV